MIARRLSFALWISIVFISACVSWTPPVTKNELLSDSDTYLYGMFEIDSPKTWPGKDGYRTMGFVFSCSDKKDYTIRFRIEDPIQVIKLNPANCSFTEMVYTSSAGEIVKSKPAQKGHLTGVELSPGNAYYIGDYFATSVRSYVNRTYTTSWKLRESNNNYEVTTSEMKSLYPNMTNVQTFNIFPIKGLEH